MSLNKSQSGKITPKEKPKFPRLRVDLEGGEENQEDYQKANLAELAKIFLQELEDQGHRYKTVTGIYYALSDFVAFSGDQTLAPSLFVNWINDLKKRNKKAWTIREWKKLCRRFFNWLLLNGHIEKNPWETFTAKSIRISGGKYKRETFTPQEYQRIKSKARGTIWYGPVIIGWATGLRLIDVATMRWEHVDFDNQVIRMIPRKTKRTNIQVVIPFPSGSDLSVWLHKMSENKHPSGFINPALAAATSEDRASGALTVEFSRWLKLRCKIQGKTFHTFRRSFLTYVMSSGVSSEVAMSMCGIQTHEILKHYYVPNITALKTAILKWKELTDEREERSDNY